MDGMYEANKMDGNQWLGLPPTTKQQLCETWAFGIEKEPDVAAIKEFISVDPAALVRVLDGIYSDINYRGRTVAAVTTFGVVLLKLGNPPENVVQLVRVMMKKG